MITLIYYLLKCDTRVLLLYINTLCRTATKKNFVRYIEVLGYAMLHIFFYILRKPLIFAQPPCCFLRLALGSQDPVCVARNYRSSCCPDPDQVLGFYIWVAAFADVVRVCHDNIYEFKNMNYAGTYRYKELAR